MLSGAELQQEIDGSRNEVAHIANRLEIIQYDDDGATNSGSGSSASSGRRRAEWMSPYTVQAVFRIHFKEPPADSLTGVEADKHTAITAAPRQVNVAMCLPDGYALLEATAVAEAEANSDAFPAFRFASPSVLKSSLNTLLMHCSPLYAHWFDVQMMEKMNELAAEQRESENESDDADNDEAA